MSTPFRIGQRVSVRGEEGTVRYCGPTNFADGNWIGVELDNPVGKHRGTVNGQVYFDCALPTGLHGVFTRENLAIPLAPSASTLSRIVEKLLQKLKVANTDIKALQQRVQMLEPAQNKVEVLLVDNETLSSTLSQTQQDLTQLQKEHDLLVQDHKMCVEELQIQAELEQEAKLALENASSESVDIIILRNKVLESALATAESQRDASTASLDAANLTLQLVAAELAASKETVAQLKTELDTAQQALSLLQAQVDAAGDLDRIVGHLTAENAELEQEISQLKTAVADLTELHELDRDLESRQRQVEEDLRNSVRQLQLSSAENQRKIKDLERVNQSLSSLRTDKDRPSSSCTLTPQSEINVEQLSQQIRSLTSANERQAVASAVSNAKLGAAKTRLSVAHSPAPLKRAATACALATSLSIQSNSLATVPDCGPDRAALIAFHRILDALSLLISANYDLAEYAACLSLIELVVAECDQIIEKAVSRFINNDSISFDEDITIFLRVTDLVDSSLALGNRFCQIVFTTLCVFWSEHWSATVRTAAQSVSLILASFQNTLLLLALEFEKLFRSASSCFTVLNALEPSLDVQFSDTVLTDLHHDWTPLKDLLAAIIDGETTSMAKDLLEKEQKFIVHLQSLNNEQLQTNGVLYMAMQEAIETQPAEFLDKESYTAEQLFNKEKLIQDLQLSVDYLENTVASRLAQDKSEIEQLKISLEKSINEYSACHAKLLTLQDENARLQKLVEDSKRTGSSQSWLVSSNKTLSDLRTQSEHSALVEQVASLTQLTRLLVRSQTVAPTVFLPLPKFHPRTNPEAKALHHCASSLRRLAVNAPIFKVSENSKHFRSQSLQFKCDLAKYRRECSEFLDFRKGVY